MNTANPFQLPSWSAIKREQRRRERFKRAVMTTIVATSLLLVGLLLLGCESERTTIAAPATSPQAPAFPTGPQSATVVASRAMPSGSNETTPMVPCRSTTVYIVKSGDTLTRIAETYGITIKAIETANGLKSDRILVGAKLIIPEV